MFARFWQTWDLAQRTISICFGSGDRGGAPHLENREMQATPRAVAFV